MQEQVFLGILLFKIGSSCGGLGAVAHTFGASELNFCSNLAAYEIP